MESVFAKAARIPILTVLLNLFALAGGCTLEENVFVLKLTNIGMGVLVLLRLIVMQEQELIVVALLVRRNVIGQIRAHVVRLG